MTDQALGLNRSIGGAVRALVAPMRESNSRTGKAEVADAAHQRASQTGIRLVYVSPERLCQAQFQRWIEQGVERGIVGRIAIDEAHTFVTWGEDFRPSFKRAERLLERLRAQPRTGRSCWRSPRPRRTWCARACAGRSSDWRHRTPLGSPR